MSRAQGIAPAGRAGRDGGRPGDRLRPRLGRLARRVPLAGAAVAGAVVAHAIAYALTVPEPGAREALLAATGHRYWPSAVATAVVLGALALVATIGRHFRRGMDGAGARAAGAHALGGDLLRLAGLQVALYLSQEVLERLASGVPLAGLAGDRVLLAGVAIQVLVATLLAALLLWLGRLAELAGRALRRPRPRIPATSPPAPLAGTPYRRSRLAAGTLGSRAPPLAPA